jgi:spindle assembly abnormal protein 6
MNINLNLTDEADPLFLYSVDIGESEFHSLKTEQSLLIDFQQFPQNLFEMLEKCNSIIKTEEYNNNYNNYSQKNIIGNSMGSYSSFVAILQFVNLNEALLVIQENNTFRSLSHLTIRLKQASDFQLKNYLSSVVKEIKEKNENLFKENSRIKELFEVTNINMKKKEEDFKKLQDTQ